MPLALLQWSLQGQGCLWVVPASTSGSSGPCARVTLLLPPLQVTERLDVSMELGCFLAGALVSSQGHKVTEEVVSYIEPIRDFLAIVFFASIGNFPLYVMTSAVFRSRAITSVICSHCFSSCGLCGEDSSYGGQSGE